MKSFLSEQFLKYIPLAILLLAVFGCGKQGIERPEGCPPYKSVIRLWPAHHQDEELGRQLIEAFRQYPKACDEVWLCTALPVTLPLEKHRESAQLVAAMADKMREIGIEPSLQTVTVGHPENASTPPDTNIHWQTVVGPNGEQTVQQSCPRQKAFLEHVEQVMEIYAGAVHPRVVWLDDDLRLTQHYPATHTCYCDTCLQVFNQQFGYQYDRPGLLAALGRNDDKGTLRHQWIDFCREGLACVAAAAARGVHRASPETRMGLQHVNFHTSMLEGYDWNQIFDAYEEETGLVPCSRPGNGYYNDHEPRGMIVKGLDLARQIRRLNPDITEIAPEIEGYVHRASGKTGHGICVETMYYLAMGATQMSYAIICSAEEPMEWYASHYFKHLQRWHDFARDYASFNWGTEPGGINPYLSPQLNYALPSPAESPLAWGSTSSGSQIYELAALGFPFCPDGNYPVALMLDGQGVAGIGDAEVKRLIENNNLIVDQATWNILESRGLTAQFDGETMPEELKAYRGYRMPGGHRLVVCSYAIESLGISGKDRQTRLHAMDWASGNRLPALLESSAQAVVIPRIDKEGNLRSVALLNCTISEEDSYTLRLRLGQNQHPKKYVWKKNGMKDQSLRSQQDGSDVILQIPLLEGWNFGWIAIE